MKSFYVLAACALLVVVCFTGCCGREPALALRSPLMLQSLTPQTAIPPDNMVGVASVPLAFRAEAAMPSYNYSAPMVTGACPAPMTTKVYVTEQTAK